MCCFYIIAKGTKKVNALWGFDAEGDDLWLLCVFSIGAGIVAAALSLLLRPTIRKAIDATPEDGDEEPVKAEQLATDMPDDKAEKKGALAWLSKLLDTDTDAVVAESAKVSEMHASAEKFPKKTEVRPSAPGERAPCARQRVTRATRPCRPPSGPSRAGRLPLHADHDRVL